MKFTVTNTRHGTLVTVHGENTTPFEYILAFYINEIKSETMFRSSGDIIIELENGQMIWFHPLHDTAGVLE